MQLQLDKERANLQLEEALRLQLFYDWLKKHDPQTAVGRSAFCYTCPIASFVSEMFDVLAYAEAKKVSVWDWESIPPTDPLASVRTPLWTSEFINIADAQAPGGTPLTAKECLQIVWHMVRSRPMKEWGDCEWQIFRKHFYEKSREYHSQYKYASSQIVCNAADRAGSLWRSIDSGDRNYYNSAINTNFPIVAENFT
jgi:hypothetical protein